VGLTRRKPRALAPGARIAVVSPASPFPEAEFSQGLDELRALGFEPVVDARVFERRGFVAGRPEVRAAVLAEALADPSIDAVIAARGGYGSVHLLPLLDAHAVGAARKPSSATATSPRCSSSSRSGAVWCASTGPPSRVA